MRSRALVSQRSLPVDHVYRMAAASADSIESKPCSLQITYSVDAQRPPSVHDGSQFLDRLLQYNYVIE